MADTSELSESSPVLSVVVFGYRNEETILRAVDSLLNQESDDRFEVIVATSGGDRTADLVHNADPELKVAESKTRLLPGGVRNLGSAVATGEIVTFLEADCVARPGWVRNRIALHRAGHEAVASALASMPSDGIIAKAALYLVHGGRLAGHPAGPAKDYQVYGLSFSRDLFERAGPFDEMLRSYEDTVMAERLQSLGVRAWFEPSVSIEHDGPDSLSEMLHDQFTRARRDSWVELLRLPAGRHRHRWDLVPGAGAALVLLRALYRLARRVRFTVEVLRQGHTGPRWELLQLLIPMVLGQIAYQLGWIGDQLKNTKRGRVAAVRDDLPTPSGVRRWVTTDGDRVVALTFNGVPPPERSQKLLRILESTRVPAAFFVAGSDARERPDEVRAIATTGHIVGSSGWSGVSFTSFSRVELEDDLTKLGALLDVLAGQTTRHVRPPGGAYDWPVVSTLDARQLKTWLWTTHPAPSPAGSPEEIVQRTMDDLTPGAVIVLDLSDDQTAKQAVAALPGIIRRARSRGYEFVDLSYVPPTGSRIGA